MSTFTSYPIAFNTKCEPYSHSRLTEMLASIKCPFVAEQKNRASFYEQKSPDNTCDQQPQRDFHIIVDVLQDAGDEPTSQTTSCCSGDTQEKPVQCFKFVENDKISCYSVDTQQYERELLSLIKTYDWEVSQLKSLSASVFDDPLFEQLKKENDKLWYTVTYCSNAANAANAENLLQKQKEEIYNLSEKESYYQRSAASLLNTIHREMYDIASKQLEEEIAKSMLDKLQKVHSDMVAVLLDRQDKKFQLLNQIHNHECNIAELSGDIRKYQSEYIKLVTAGDRTQKYVNKNGFLHTTGVLPSVIKANGTKQWHVDGLLHSVDGRPSVVKVDGTKKYHVKGILHSVDDKPSVTFPDGSRYWHINGKLGRDNDLPAVITHKGTAFWYRNGELGRKNGLYEEVKNYENSRQRTKLAVEENEPRNVAYLARQLKENNKCVITEDK